MKPKLHAVSAPASTTSGDGNPFLTHIPEVTDDLQLVRRLGFNPFSDPRWQGRVADPERLLNHLRMTFIPTPRTLRLAKKILRAIRNGYEARDPRFPAAWSSYFQSDSRVIYADIDPVTQDGIAIPGITGMGKSTLIKRILGLMPRTIVHERLGDHLIGVKQVVWLYVEMNTGRGLGALLYRILYELDQALETSQYAPLSLTKREDLGVLEDRVLRALKTHFVGAVAIDEAQRVNLQEKDGSERARNFLVQLMNTGIPVILLGSPLGLQFREKERQSAQLMGRLLEDPRNRLVPPETPDHEEWQILVRGLWQCQLMPERAPLTEEMYSLLHRLTGGIPKTLTALLAESQRHALSLGHKMLSPPVILHAAAESSLLKSLKPLIDGLVGKDPVKLRVYSDVDHDRLSREWIPDEVSSGMEIGHAAATRKQKGGEALAAEDRKRFKSEQTRRKHRAGAKEGGTKMTPLGEEHIAQLDAIMNRKERGDG